MFNRYDDLVNVYSPSGHLMQLEYADVAAGLCNKHCIVIGAEKKKLHDLQIERTSLRIKKVDQHIAMTFAGLTADARILVERAQAEAQSHRLNFDRPASVEHITRYLAKLKQEYTQSAGRRPFGVSCLIGGFDENGTSHLFETNPSGIYDEWKASATGRTSQIVLEYFEKNYSIITQTMDVTSTVNHVVRALLMGSVSGTSHFDMVVIKNKEPMERISMEKMKDIVSMVNQEMHGYATRQHFGI